MGLGSLLSLSIDRDSRKFQSMALSFSAGIMIYISFMAILPEGIELIESVYDEGHLGHFIALASFFGGMILIALVEKLLHRFSGDIHDHGGHGSHDHNHEHISSLSMASAVAIAIHNLPEGLAIFTAGLKDIKMAVPLGLAVVLHNIPLSIAISIPIYHSTGSRKKAFLYTSFVGLFQPLGAILGYLIFAKSFNDLIFGILFTFVAGIMIFVTLDELLPTAYEYDNHHIPVYGTILGMLVMAISLVLFHHH